MSSLLSGPSPTSPTRTRAPGPGVQSLCVLIVTAVLVAVPCTLAVAQEKVEAGPVLGELVLDGATVFSREDVLWLLQLRIGQALPGTPDHVAEILQRRYERDGYDAARVTAAYDDTNRRLTLRVDEGRIDDVQFEGLPAALVDRFRADLGVGSGDLFNRRSVRERLDRLLVVAGGALRIGKRGPDLVSREGRRVLVIPIDQRKREIDVGLSSEAREDFFSPVDGVNPAVSLTFTRFDPVSFNHTFVRGHVSYKFAREDPGYSLGIEQPFLSSPRSFVGAEVYDITTSDDLWRLSSSEQTLVALTFRNTFRDYFRRRGGELSGGVRLDREQEIVAGIRWDKHEAMENETDFSFFRNDHPFRLNPRIDEGDVHSIVFAYTLDSRGLADDNPPTAYQRHRLDDLYRDNRRQAFGWRLDWTSEIAGHGLGGDHEFDRHILNVRTYLPLGDRQAFAARVLFGLSGGSLPVQRRFALGGIGSVHGYAFKESVGEQMTLLNAEYRISLSSRRGSGLDLLRVFVFYDAGKIRDAVGASRSDWLQGTGVGLQSGPVRVEFGFRLDAIPESRQILVRISPTF